MLLPLFGSYSGNHIVEVSWVGFLSGRHSLTADFLGLWPLTSFCPSSLMILTHCRRVHWGPIFNVHVGLPFLEEIRVSRVTRWSVHCGSAFRLVKCESPAPDAGGEARQSCSWGDMTRRKQASRLQPWDCPGDPECQRSSRENVGEESYGKGLV